MQQRRQDLGPVKTTSMLVPALAGFGPGRRISPGAGGALADLDADVNRSEARCSRRGRIAGSAAALKAAPGQAMKSHGQAGCGLNQGERKYRLDRVELGNAQCTSSIGGRSLPR